MVRTKPFVFLLLCVGLGLTACGSDQQSSMNTTTRDPDSSAMSYSEYSSAEEDSENTYDEGGDEDSSSSMEETYRVTWLNDDGSVLEEDDDYHLDDIPTYDGIIPTRNVSEDYYYSFVGWSPKVQKVTGNATYRATYRDISNYDSYGLSYSSVEGGYSVSAGNAKYFPDRIIIPRTYNGQNIVAISYNGFRECLASSIIIPNTVKSIGDYAFYGCLELEDIHLPSELKTMGSYAFYNCSKLKSISIPSGVTSIGGYAFVNCNKLTSITIPSSVLSIGYTPLAGCSALTSISTSFVGTGAITDTYGHIGELFGTTEFDDTYRAYGYYIPKELKTVNITGGAYKIGSYAFKDCTSLTSITISFATSSIDQNAFEGCNELKSISIPHGVTGIEQEAFKDCTSLSSITIPSSVTKIGKNAFNGCTNLTSVIMEEGVNEIGEFAFRNCSKLRNVSFPSSITKLGRGAFTNCSSISYNSYEGAYYLGNENNPYVLLAKTKSKDFSTFTINPKTSIIGEYAFYDCVLLSSIVIPSTITFICNNAFQNCVSLVNVTIGNHVTSIGEGAFLNCSNIVSLVIPNNVTYIGFGALAGLSALKSISVPFVGTKTENSSDSSFCSIFGSTQFSGSVAAGSYYAPAQLRDVVITNHSSEEFGGFSSCTFLRKFEVPNGVNTISWSAFSGCTNLETIILPASLHYVYYSAFSNCTSLKTVNNRGSSKSNISIDYYNNSYFINATWINYYSD